MSTGGTAQNPLAVPEEALALASAIYVIKLDTTHVTVLTRNQLEVHHPRKSLGIGLEHQGVCSP